jgi:hypothetical protein
VAAGLEGAPDERRLPPAMDSLAARVATARDPGAGERCIANPVWVAPVRAEIATSPGAARARPGVALPAGALRVAFHFPLSMSAEAGTRACLRPLDSRGNSTDPEIELVPDPGWEEESGVTNAWYSAVNPEDVHVPPGAWDAGAHTSVAGTWSFVVYLKGLADVHGNRLNDVGWTFTIACADPPPAAGDGPSPARGR